MTKTKHTIVAALIAAAFTSAAHAGTSSAKISSAVSPNSKSDLTGSLETSVVSNYTYRGQVLDSNPVFVPKLNVQYPVFQNGTLQIGVEQLVGTVGSTWFRSRYNVGLAVNAGSFTVTPGFEVKSYPNRDNNTSQSINARVEFNDAGLLPLKLNPYAYVSHDVDPKGGSCYEVGVAPTKHLGSVELTFPITVGIGSNSYYAAADTGARYAYTSAGIGATKQLTDRVALKAGASYYNTDSHLNNAATSFVQSRVGIAVSF